MTPPLIDQRHRLGHASIDRALAAIGESWSRTIGCDPIQFPFLLARLRKLLRAHFDHESALMRQAGGRLCECHQREHQSLLDLCDRAAALSQANWRRSQSLLRNAFPRLLRAHVATMDQIAVLFINSQDSAPNSERL